MMELQNLVTGLCRWGLQMVIMVKKLMGLTEQSGSGPYPLLQLPHFVLHEGALQLLSANKVFQIGQSGSGNCKDFWGQNG